MLIRIFAVVTITAAAAYCADWSPRLAADYLDSRQKAWFAWPNANRGEDGPCLSCHTGLSYLLARPALGRALGETEATSYQGDLMGAVRKRVGKKTPKEYAPKGAEPSTSQALGVESVLSSLLFAMEDARRGALNKDTEQAFDRMWSLQIASGKNKGAWIWNSYDLDPWEEPDSTFYGASLAALATGIAPSGYQARPAIQENLKALKTYIASELSSQPLHNRLVLLWASSNMVDLLSASERKKIIEDALQKQQPDGGWAIESLGAWTKHPNAPPSEGSNAYATGLVAFTLQQAGVPRTKQPVANALNWLREHQDRTTGSWNVQSMNKRYEADSMQSNFMRDAATAFASLALIEPNSSATHTH